MVKILRKKIYTEKRIKIQQFKPCMCSLITETHTHIHMVEWTVGTWFYNENKKKNYKEKKFRFSVTTGTCYSCCPLYYYRYSGQNEKKMKIIQSYSE